MKTKKILIVLILFSFVFTINAQNKDFIPDLSKVNNSNIWTLVNRNLKYDNSVYLNAEKSSGLLILNDLNFRNGTIELDIKGKDIRGKSFVGIAFHGLNDSTYDAIYFRPFNFKSPERHTHAVQYISHPIYTWYKLRNEHPEQYEKLVSPVPDPTDWFHATIVVNYPNVSVYVNNSEEPSLTVKQLSNRKEGWLGFWVGNGSDGYFKNLKITVK